MPYNLSQRVTTHRRPPAPLVRKANPYWGGLGGYLVTIPMVWGDWGNPKGPLTLFQVCLVPSETPGSLLYYGWREKSNARLVLSWRLGLIDPPTGVQPKHTRVAEFTSVRRNTMHRKPRKTSKGGLSNATVLGCVYTGIHQ